MRPTRVGMMLLIALFAGYFSQIFCQVKITDGSDPVPDLNSILELESSTRGLLPPRVAINSVEQASPLTAPVPAGMMVYSSGGAVPDGFYYWNGAKWINFLIPETLVVKSESSTLLKNERFVLASGDITLTLPSVTSSDNGLSITVKNVGSHVDLVNVAGNSGASIDGSADSFLTRWNSQTYIAWNGNWITKNKAPVPKNSIMVSERGSFKSIKEALEFLSEHMTAPTVIILGDELNTLSEAIVINLPYPVTIEGSSYGTSTIGPAAGMAGKTLFTCDTECYFKKLNFDAGTLPGYGSSPGEDAVHLSGNTTYNEIKDCNFDGFYNTVSVLSDAELWLFESDINNSSGSGVILNSPVPGTTIKISETDFSNNKVGINLYAGSATTVTINSGYFANGSPDDIAILYNPSSFSFSNLIIDGNSWNFIGEDISGFDFSRSDGRDANAFIENNAGVEDQKPHCKINVINNSLTTTCTIANAWYKANWVNTSAITTSLAISNNRIRYLPRKQRDIMIIVAGDVTVSNNNRVITIGIVRNGNTAIRYGETALRVTTANQPFQFSTVIYIEDVARNDYFELYCSSSSNNDVLNFQDIHIYLTAQ
jgi:hypothetical protein